MIEHAALFIPRRRVPELRTAGGAGRPGGGADCGNRPAVAANGFSPLEAGLKSFLWQNRGRLAPVLLGLWEDWWVEAACTATGGVLFPRGKSAQKQDFR